MNYLNFIFIGLIFFSLVVIIIIFGRNAKKLDQIKPELLEKKNGKNLLLRLFGFFFQVIKSFFIFLIEWLVKKTKKILHLIHFWVIKAKKGKDYQGLTGEIEAKEELFLEEKESLDQVVHDDLGQAEEEEYLAQEKKDEALIVSEKPIEKGEDQKEEQSEILEMIEEKEPMEEKKEEKTGIWSRIKNRWRKKDESIEIKEEPDGREDNFSDGVIKVERAEDFSNEAENENGPMVQDVTFKEEKHFDEDDNLGVDREILEKKILQKIARDPKNIEHYRQLGKLYIKMDNLEDALASYQFILKIKARDVDARRKIEKIKLLRRLNGKH